MDVFVARQPIFDLSGDVSGYELPYRRGAQSAFADGQSTDQMSVDVVIQSVLEVGLDRITRRKTGFLNFGREMLLSHAYELLDPETIVIELLEDVVVDEQVMDACKAIAGAGYRLALDDFVEGGKHHSFLPYASILKVDVLERELHEIRALADRLRKYPVTLLAEKVETFEMHEECSKAGFQLFQGYFYSRPELVANRGVSVTQASIINFMNLLGSDRATDLEVEEGFRRDATLSYKLLRILSSAAHGARGIESIRYAVRLLGRATLQRWMSLLLVSSFAGRGTEMELVRDAVLRARFCELLGIRAGRSAYGDALFLVGLFSLMDALLKTPMEEVLARVDLSHPVRCALAERTGPHAPFLQLAEAYESGKWDTVTFLAGNVGVLPSDVAKAYVDAVDWSREQVERAAA